jgi:chemotaxis protein methyltransferase CheR
MSGARNLHNFDQSRGLQQLDRLKEDREGFLELAELIYQRAGIHLPENSKNLTLMASRLNKLVDVAKLGTLTEVARRARRDTRLMEQVIEAMTTNTTYFFRESSHFDLLPGVARDLLDQKAKSSQPAELRVWCAAASSGQEPWTILITLLEAFGDKLPFQLKFLATDISIEVLEEASMGVYTESEIQGLSPTRQSKYLNSTANPIKAKSGAEFRVRKDLLSQIRFAQFNLMSDPYPFKRKFDIIFCRNVLIYFDRPTVERTIEKMTGCLSPGGSLFLGHSESGMMRRKDLKTISHAAYRKV